MRKFIGSLLLLTVVFTACNNEKKLAGSSEETGVNTLTKKEKKEGWKLLFDGTSTKGWHRYGNKPMGSGWTIADNSIMLDSKKGDGGDIVTDEEFDNFELKYDWKISEGGNSGVIIYIYEDAQKYVWPWQTGPEMQVLDNERHGDAKIIKHRAGDLYDLLASSSEPVKPALQWNHAVVRSLNGKLDLYLNGVNVVSTTMWDDNWKKLIANSKFKNSEGFGAYKKGKLGLQDHGNDVWFRNIKIRKL